MLDKFWESIGSDLAARWVEYIFGPAFLFWGGALGLYVWKTGWQDILNDIQTLTPFQQGTLILLGLLVLVFSSILMQAIHFPLLRLLEGYWPWPFNYLGVAINALRKLFFQKSYGDLRSLKDSEGKGELDVNRRERLIQLDVWVHWHPAKASDLLPTTLGNILRSREHSPERKYGMDAVVCWPRLWMLLPENPRSDLTNARFSLDRLTELWLWGALFLVWINLTPWALLISLVWMVLTYNLLLQAAMAYGDLLESAFDVHRLLLYDSLGWPRPNSSEEDKTQGARLTEFLWRGTLSVPLSYTIKQE